MRTSARHAHATLLTIAIIGILVLLFNGWRTCTKQGGHYVRGVLFMECIR